MFHSNGLTAMGFSSRMWYPFFAKATAGSWKETNKEKNKNKNNDILEEGGNTNILVATLPYVCGLGYKWWLHRQTSLFQPHTASLIQSVAISNNGKAVKNFKMCFIICKPSNMFLSSMLCCFPSFVRANFLGSATATTWKWMDTTHTLLLMAASTIRSLTPTFIRSGWMDAKLE